MNSWVKHAILAAITIQCIICIIPQCFGIQNQKNEKFYSLPATSIQCDEADRNSPIFSYNVLKIILNKQSQLSFSIKSLKSETMKIELESDGILIIHRLPNISFWDLIKAVDDNENNNYLNRDF